MDPVKIACLTILFALIGLFFLYLVAAAIHDFAVPALKRRKKARLRAKDPIAQMVDFKQARRRDEIRSWEEHWERIAGVCYSGYGVEPLGVEIRKAPPVIVLPDIRQTAQVMESRVQRDQIERWLELAEQAARKNDMVTYARVMDKLRAAQHA